MKFYEPRSSKRQQGLLTYDEVRARVNGRQPKRKTITIGNRTHLRLHDDRVEFTFEPWGEPTQVLATYYPEHIELTMPERPGSEILAIRYRYSDVIRDIWHHFYVDRIPSGPHKGLLGIHEWQPSHHSGEMWKTRYVRMGLAAIPLLRDKPVRIAYTDYRAPGLADLDLDSIALPEERQVKLLELHKKRSASARQRVEILKELGFPAGFYLSGYPLPKGLTLEKARAAKITAQAMGFHDVEAAWYAGVYVTADMSEEDAEMLSEGLGPMFVELHKTRRREEKRRGTTK